MSARPPSASALPTDSALLPGTQGSVRRPLRPFVCVALLPPYSPHLTPLPRCIYFLDPDQIVPPSIPGAPAPPVPRPRANSFSQPEQEPVILDPPVATNPLLTRATLPAADITTIRRLSTRVNVLPVIARADLLPNERLAAIKVAIRKDLADAGIGFGIFDIDTQYPRVQDDHPPSIVSDGTNGFTAHPNGSAPAHVTPPTSPVTPLLRLPYALISPDIYSHSDGVSRPSLSRHELFNQYNPSSQPAYPLGSRLARGKYLRNYRWGSLDVLEPSHCDFVPLRTAIFHHMEVCILPRLSLVSQLPFTDPSKLHA